MYDSLFDETLKTIYAIADMDTSKPYPESVVNAISMLKKTSNSLFEDTGMMLKYDSLLDMISDKAYSLGLHCTFNTENEDFKKILAISVLNDDFAGKSQERNNYDCI